MWFQHIKERVLGANKGASKTRILIADDNDLYRTALSLILKAKNMEVIDEVSTGREAVEATFKNNPDVLLLDVAMPDMDGLAALTTIKYLCPETKIIVLTSLSDPSVRSRAEALGADAFVNKSNEIPTLIDSIRAITSESEQLETPDGQVQFNGTQKLNYRLGAPIFTPQEIRIITFLAEGETNATITDRLSIGANTLKSHMRNIFKKSGCQNRTQVALWAIRNGIVE